MSLIVAIIVGALAGYAAQYLMKTEAPYGLIGDIVLGIIGGIVGDAVLGLVGLTGFGLIGSFIVAVIGAVIFIYVLRMIM